MATIQAHALSLFSSSRASELYKKTTFVAALNVPKSAGTRRTNNVSFSNMGLLKEFEFGANFADSLSTSINVVEKQSDWLAMEKLYAILEVVADRVEMHKNIGEQRNNWNSLLLSSINGITLAAATMSATAATVIGAPMAALKLSSTILYLAATGMLVIMNTIQPSQLVEEQRNATRQFQQLRNHIQRLLTIGNPTNVDVNEAVEKVLAIDRAYPLPLLGVMLEKFPSTVKPAVWWPQQQRKQQLSKFEASSKKGLNGWNGKLEEEMRNIVDVLRNRDEAEYLRLGEKALKLNKLMAISGPVLTGIAALGSIFVGYGSWAVMLGVVGGALASVVSTFEHGGQIGMVFEMYRSNAGFFKLMNESIQSNLNERELERRESGELLEMKVALQLGRSLSDLRDFSSSNQIKDESASKLF